MDSFQFIKILVVDDNCMLIKALENVFKNSKFIKIIGSCQEDSEILPFLMANKTDIILLELMAKKVNGFETIKRIKNYSSEISIIGFSFMSNRYFVDEVLGAGADGFVSKFDTNRKEMEEEICRVMLLS